VASLDRNNLVVFYWLRASEIWLIRGMAFDGSGPIGGGTTVIQI